MSDQIIKVIDAICEKFGIAIDWTQGNIFPYLQELSEKYIKYEIATSIAWCFVFPLLAAIGFTVAKMSHKEKNNSSYLYDSSEYSFWATIAGWACIVISVIVLFTQVFDIVTCLTFPEKKILEYANHLLNGGV